MLCEVLKDNVVQILVGPSLKPKSQLLWSNEVKAILAELWFERSWRVFQDKALAWMDHFEIARIDAFS